MSKEIFKALLDWNPWLLGSFPEELLGVPRRYELLEYLDVPEIKIIEGARRVGKSTLLYQVIYQLYKTHKDILYVNFEDETLQKYSLSEVISAYLEHSPISYLFVDEVQNCEGWVQVVRKMYDRREMKQMWISGSNASLIKKEYATLLTGRNLSIHISPLSFCEFLTFKNIKLHDENLPSISQKKQIEYKKYFSEYLKYGSFPAIANRNVLKKELLISYFEDFIYKDIVSRHNANATKIKELAIYLASNSSKLFSYRNIAGILNVHPNTIQDYCNYLKESFLFEELYKFDYSLKKQYSNEKKIYCLDVGLASAISFKFSDDIGRILENLVFCELKRRKKEIYFHKAKKECDFLIKEELDIISAIQVSFSLKDEKTAERELSGLIEALEIYNLKKGIILTFDEDSAKEIFHNGKKYTVDIIPIWKWLL